MHSHAERGNEKRRKLRDIWGFFVEAGKDVNAKNPQGLTMAQVIAQHRNGGEYLQALKGAGAK
jgi:hypothetical protein